MEKKSYLKKVSECLRRSTGCKTTIMARFLRLSMISFAIIVISLIVYTGYSTGNLLTGEYDKQTSGFAGMAAASTKQWIGLIKNQIEAMAGNQEFVDEKLTVAQRKELLAQAVAGTEFLDLSVAYSDGSTYNDTDIHERDYFTYAMKGQTYISSPIVRKTDNSLTIMVGTKITVPGFEGVLYGAIPLDYFGEILNSTDFGETGFGFMTDATGTIIVHRDEELVRNMVNPVTQAKSDASYKELAATVSEMKDKTTFNNIFTSYDGIKYYGGYAPVDTIEGWSVGVLIGYDEVTEHYNKMTKNLIVMAVILLILAFFANLLVATEIAYPVRVAAERLNKLAKGDLTSSREQVKIPDDETGTLLKALDLTIEQLNSYIGDIDVTLANIADGNLDMAVTQEYTGDFVAIKENLNKLLDILNSTFARTSSTCAGLLNGAREVEAASQSLASATTEQASAVVEITASMEGIAKSTADNTADVVRVDSLTQTAKHEADHGDVQMQKMVGAMNEISDASQSIAKIMKVIDDIAFQTNILALNASVEAARAGVHGRGFAVVAEEVRSLAGKSASASAEIAEMIEDSIEKIETGTVIASDTAAELKKIVSDIDEIAAIMDNIATVSRDQAQAVEQVNAGIEQISAGVQNNSATSEECAASSVALTDQANGLMQQINFFKLRR